MVWQCCTALRWDHDNLGIYRSHRALSKIAGFTNVIDIACNASSPFALRRNGTVGFPNLWASAPRNGTNIAAIAAGSHNVLGLVGQGPPIFPGASLNRSVVVGATAFFRALAVGSTPRNHQWIGNGTNVLGATNTFLAITNAQLAQAGNLYSLIASNALGMVTNTASALNVTPAEAYIQPQMLSAVAGSTATFTASTIGQGPFTYQWQFNGINLQNATNVSLICSNVQLSNAGDYNVIVTNAFGDASDSAALAVLPFVFNMGSNPLFTTNGLQLQLTGVFATNSVILYLPRIW